MHMWVLQRVRITIDQPTEPVWGASPPTPQRWGLRETLVAAGGGFATKLTQTGTVTAISPTAITVASTDGFAETYELQAAAHTDRTVAVSDQVSIQGTRAGQVTTATSVDIQMGPDGPLGPPGPAPHN